MFLAERAQITGHLFIHLFFVLRYLNWPFTFHLPGGHPYAMEISLQATRRPLHNNIHVSVLVYIRNNQFKFGARMIIFLAPKKAITENVRA
jgi:hypothetical protein